MRSVRSGAVKIAASVLMCLAINVILVGSVEAAPKPAGPGQQCAGFAGVPCRQGLWCDFDPGQCHAADGAGRCATVPQICPMIYAPVCGCDGKTYGNDCKRRGHKVSLEHVGPCSK